MISMEALQIAAATGFGIEPPVILNGPNFYAVDRVMGGKKILTPKALLIMLRPYFRWGIVQR